MFSGNIVIIGSSTGGPNALYGIFTGLPMLRASIIIVQHMPAYINESLQRNLNEHTDMVCKKAVHTESLKDGAVYIAPSGIHLHVSGNRKIRLAEGDKVNYVCPSIDVAMKSMTTLSKGETVTGILLSGMGKDGAEGMAHLKNIGGATIIQDQESSVVNSMPKKAFITGKIDKVMNPEQISTFLIDTFR